MSEHEYLTQKTKDIPNTVDVRDFSEYIRTPEVVEEDYDDYAPIQELFGFEAFHGSEVHFYLQDLFAPLPDINTSLPKKQQDALTIQQAQLETQQNMWQELLGKIQMHPEQVSRHLKNHGWNATQCKQQFSAFYYQYSQWHVVNDTPPEPSKLSYFMAMCISEILEEVFEGVIDTVTKSSSSAAAASASESGVQSLTQKLNAGYTEATAMMRGRGMTKIPQFLDVMRTIPRGMHEVFKGM